MIIQSLNEFNNGHDYVNNLIVVVEEGVGEGVRVTLVMSIWICFCKYNNWIKQRLMQLWQQQEG